MKYSLYIDESGDFETPRGEWVLAGLLFSESYDQCENILNLFFLYVEISVGFRILE